MKFPFYSKKKAATPQSDFQAITNKCEIDMSKMINIKILEQDDWCFAGPTVLSMRRIRLYKQKNRLVRQIKTCHRRIKLAAKCSPKINVDVEKSRLSRLEEQQTQVKRELHQLTELLKIDAPTLPFLRSVGDFKMSDQVFYWTDHRPGHIHFQPGEILQTMNGLVEVGLDLNRRRFYCSVHDARLLSKKDYDYLYSHPQHFKR